MQYNPVVNRRYAPSSRRDDPEWFMLPSTLALDAFRAIEEDHDAEVHDRHQRLVIHRVPTLARRAALRFRLLQNRRYAPSSRRDDPEWFMLPSTLALDAFRAIEEDHDAEVHDRHQRHRDPP